MKVLNLLPLLTVLFLLASPTNTNQVNPGCLTVTQATFRSKPQCSICYRRKFADGFNTDKCRPLLSPTDKCLYYSYSASVDGNVCVACRDGLALDQKTGTCIPGTIERCISETYGTNDTRFCAGCKGQYYAQLYKGVSKCVPTSQVANPVYNCLNGGLYERFNSGFTTTGCAQCKPGFSLSWDTSKCVRAQFEGCIRVSQSGRHCNSCNVVEGYSMQDDYTCVKF